MDMGVGGVMSGAGGIGGAKPPLPGAPDAKVHDVERFNEMMGNQAAPEIRPADSVGQQALDGLSELSASVRTDRQNAMDLLNAPGATQMDLIGAQFSMLESSNKIAAVSKIAERITQGVKTLQQG